MSSPGKVGVGGLGGVLGGLAGLSGLAGLGGSGTVSKATIAVSNVDGRAFDILLWYVRII